MTTELRQLIRSDLYRHTGKVDGSSLRYALLHIPGFRYCYFLRRCMALRSKRGPLNRFRYIVNKVALNRYRFKYGFEIGAGTRIGPGFYLGHLGAWSSAKPRSSVRT